MDISNNVQGQLLLEENLTKYNTWRVGGKARQLYKPKSIEDVAVFLQSLAKKEPIAFLGLGSNSLIREEGFRGTVVLTQGCLKNITLVSEDTVRVEAGVSCATMARFCARHFLTGGEFWAGIPGTMGGALRMNAGCFQKETWDWVEEVETVTRDGALHKRKPQEFQISYRQALGLSQEEWFVAGTFRLPKGDKETSLRRIKELLEHRANTQPISEYNCGSVFRNPKGNYAAKLIESCGLKGKQVGGARVSEKHANFIINQNGEASAKDIESLIALVQQTVEKSTHIFLTPEVHILGERYV
jgi:UDP-N-acetylmuramate dehydrogenase